MPSVLTLDKSLLVLEAVFFSKEGVGTRTLARKLKMNVATVHNIARTYCARGYLRQDSASKLFFPGTRLMLLGRHPAYLHSLTDSAGPVVREVAEQLNESILLGSIDQGRIINLLYIPSKQALRVQEPEDVSAHSYSTAFGKVLLASLSEVELGLYLRSTKLRAFTPKTLATPEKLRQELAKVRENNFARTCDEHSEGISAVAVPIRDPWGAIIASIGASAPTMRMQKPGQFEENLRVLKKAAADIEHIWGKDMQPQPEKKILRKKTAG